MKYLIVREHDDSLVSGVEHDNDDDAEQALGEMSEGYPGSLLLFRHGKLMAWAKLGDVFSYRPDNDREAVAA